MTKQHYDSIQFDPNKIEVNPISGAVRTSKKGKGRFDLIPPEVWRRLAIHFENGAVAHGDRNWERGMALSVYYNAITRHTLAYLEGDDTEDHLAAIVWNVSCIMNHERRLKSGELPQEFSDLPERKGLLQPRPL